MCFKKGFSDSGFLVLCKYNNALILKSIQVFAQSQRIQLVLLKKTSCPANAYVYLFPVKDTPTVFISHFFVISLFTYMYKASNFCLFAIDKTIKKGFCT